MILTKQGVGQFSITRWVKVALQFTGRVQLGKNQLSYETKKFKPSLPKFYSTVKLPTLTYVIQIVHEHMQAKINALNVICIPNGQLLSHYGNDILQAGKGGWSKAKDVRYNYAREPKFILLSSKEKAIYRIEVILMSKNFSIKEITGKNLPIKPFKII